MQWIARATALVAILAVAPACAWNRVQLNQADLESRAARVVEGQTTVTEMEKLLGGPATSITPIGDKLLYVYTYGDAKFHAFSIIILTIGKTNSAVDTALFLADGNNVIEWKKVGTNSSKTKWEWWAFGDN